MMNARIQAALNETAALLVKWEGRKTFDQYQEAEKQARIREYATHMIKLADMLA
jgi:hypothetical protein